MSTYIYHPKSQRGVGTINVPIPITRAIPADAKFECELVDEGILFRFVGIVARSEKRGAKMPEQLPDWTQNGAA